MVGPCDWDADTFEPYALGVVKGGADDRRVVPAAFCFDGVERVADVPAWVYAREECAGGDGRELGG